MRSIAVVLAVWISMMAPVGGVPAGEPGIVIEKPWARASILKSRPGAAYLSIRNGGSEPDRLLKVTSPVAGAVMIHESKMSDGMARMTARDAVEIAPGTRVIFRPGGLHLMLTDLSKPLRKGEALTLILEFERAGRIDVMAPVLGLGAKGPE